ALPGTHPGTCSEQSTAGARTRNGGEEEAAPADARPGTETTRIRLKPDPATTGALSTADGSPARRFHGFRVPQRGMTTISCVETGIISASMIVAVCRLLCWRCNLRGGHLGRRDDGGATRRQTLDDPRADHRGSPHRLDVSVRGPVGWSGAVPDCRKPASLR